MSDATTSFPLLVAIGVVFGPLKPGRTQGRFELAQVLGQFRRPTHALARLVRVFEAEGFGMQGLPREFNERTVMIVSAMGRIICAVADQRMSGVGGLRADLMLPARLQPES